MILELYVFHKMICKSLEVYENSHFLNNFYRGTVPVLKGYEVPHWCDARFYTVTCIFIYIVLAIY